MFFLDLPIKKNRKNFRMTPFISFPLGGKLFHNKGVEVFVLFSWYFTQITCKNQNYINQKISEKLLVKSFDNVNSFYNSFTLQNFLPVFEFVVEGKNGQYPDSKSGEELTTLHII